MPQSTDATTIPIFDGHNDVLLDLLVPARGGGRSFFERSEEGHLDLPRAREAGFAGGIFAIFVPSPGIDYAAPPDPSWITTTEDGYEVRMADAIDPGYAHEFAGRAISGLYRMEDAGDGALKVVRSLEELLDCLERQVLAVVLHFEGAEPVDARLRNLEELYGRGLRSVGITWSRPNAFGWGVPFKFPASPDTGPGLTPAGKDLVRACNELGILLDLAHLNEQGFWDVARLSRAPLVVTHSAAHALVPSTRNLVNDQLAAIADTNGVVGLTFAVYDLSVDGRREEDAPLSALADHVEYISGRFGIDHVAFGSDFDGAQIPKEMGDVTGYPRLLALLRDRGFDDAALRKLAHENWMRVIRDTWHD